MKRGPISKSSDVLKGRRKKFFIKILWGLLVFLLLLIGLAFLSRIDDLEIQTISIDGNDMVSSEEVETEINKTLSRNRFLFFSGRNKLIYSKASIENEVKKNIPRILSVDVKRDGSVLNVSVGERERAYLWCGEKLSSDTECYFLDKSGFIFDIAPQFSPGIYFTFYSSIEGEPIGQYILNFDIIKDIDIFVEAISRIGLPINSLAYMGEGQYEFYTTFGSITNPAKILFTKDQTLDEVFNKIASIIDQDPFKSDFEASDGRLEYIDVRFKNRVFYRFYR